MALIYVQPKINDYELSADYPSAGKGVIQTSVHTLLYNSTSYAGAEKVFRGNFQPPKRTARVQRYGFRPTQQAFYVS